MSKNPPMKILALEIDFFDLESGVDRISLVENEAIESPFMYFKSQKEVEITDEYLFEKVVEDILLQKYIDDLSEDKQDNLLAQLELVGESQEKLEADGWIIEEIAEGDEFAISSKPNLSSLEDYGKFQIRYKYTGPRDSKNRNFCSRMLSANLIFRKEDINKLTITGENSEFGIYNIFEFKGSYGCRHYWTRLRMYKGDEGKEITQYEEAEDAATSVNAKPTMNRNPDSSTLIESNFEEQRKEKQLIAGPLMIPNKFIYRYDVYNGDYYVYFSKDTIEKISHKYLINKHQDSVNLEHSEENVVDSISLVESWLVEDPEKDKSYALMGKKYEKGTWFGIMRVDNKEVWEEHVKTGKVKGFSVEGFFADKMINASKQTFYYRTTEGGTEILIDENTSVVFILKDGERAVMLPDGEYKLTNGETLVVADSKAQGTF